MQSKLTFNGVDYTFTETGDSLGTAAFYIQVFLLLFSGIAYPPPQFIFQVALVFHVSAIAYSVATATKDESSE